MADLTSDTFDGTATNVSVFWSCRVSNPHLRLQVLEQPLNPLGERRGNGRLPDLSQPDSQLSLKVHPGRTRGAAREVLLQLSSLHDPYLVI